MIRSFFGVVLGLIVGLAIVGLCMGAAWLVLGADGSFKPRSFTVSGGWIAASFVALALGGVGSGAICAKLAPTPAASRALAGILLALGLAGSATSFRDAPPRRGEVTVSDAVTKAHTPLVPALVNALVIGAGTVAGGFVARRKH